MQIIEVKNNLVKIGYEPDQEYLILSGFLAMKEESTDGQGNSFIGQIMHLESTPKGSFAIVKLLFNFNAEGVITNYNGSIPSIKSVMSYVETKDLLGLLPVKNPVVIGEVAQQNIVLNLDESLFKDKLVVCSEREEDKKVLIKNINAQLAGGGKKVLVFDLLGDFDFSPNKLVASEDFKLPLNYETINFIYEKGLETNNAEVKALIQEVFLEVQDYVKTLAEGFIPFESFKNVVDAQYQELGVVELVLLKNKLLKYYEKGVFAQTKDQFESLKNSLNNRETTILDLSKVEEKIQREVISYAYSLINQSDEEVFVLLNVDNSNSDKKLLKQIYTTDKAFSTVICSYSYKYLNELKQLAKDLILFAPINQQKDFASYNTFVNKLNPDEFIIYGNATHNLPLIVKLDDSPQQGFSGVVPAQESFSDTYIEDENEDEEISVSPTTDYHDDLLDEQIRQEVDQIYAAPQYEKEQQEFVEDSFEETATEGLTEDDLDFIDDLSEVQEEEIQSEDHFDDEFADDFFGDDEAPEQEEDFLQAQAQSNFEQPSELTSQEEMEEPSFFQEEFSSPLVGNIPPSLDILPASDAVIPNLPIYPAEVDAGEGLTSDELEQGDIVIHAKYGKGTVEKMISYGTKTLCSIHFDNVGRRLLDPTLAELKKV